MRNAHSMLLLFNFFFSSLFFCFIFLPFALMCTLCSMLYVMWYTESECVCIEANKSLPMREQNLFLFYIFLPLLLLLWLCSLSMAIRKQFFLSLILIHLHINIIRQLYVLYNIIMQSNQNP